MIERLVLERQRLSVCVEQPRAGLRAQAANAGYGGLGPASGIQHSVMLCGWRANAEFIVIAAVEREGSTFFQAAP